MEILQSERSPTTPLDYSGISQPSSRRFYLYRHLISMTNSVWGSVLTVEIPLIRHSRLLQVDEHLVSDLVVLFAIVVLDYRKRLLLGTEVHR